MRFEAGSFHAVTEESFGLVYAPKVVIAYLSVGDGFVARKLGVWNAEFSWWEGFTSFQVGDVTGDGAVDFVHVDEGRIVTTELPWRESPDLLEAVTDSGSAYPLELFSYDSVWWGTGPRPEPAPCQYPWSCSRRSFPVVRSHAVFQGTMPQGGPRYRETLHSFADPRSDLRGRGFLGFGEHRIWDRQLGAETRRVFDHSLRIDPGGEFYPLAMVPVEVRTTTPLLPLPADWDLPWNPNFPGVTGDSALVKTRTVVTQYDYELRTDPAEPYRYTRLLSGVSTSEYDDLPATAVNIEQEVPSYTEFWLTSGGEERHTSSTYVRDDYGNPTLTTEVTDGGVTTTVARTFENRIDLSVDGAEDWILGLVTRSETRSGTGAPSEPARVVRTEYDAFGRAVRVKLRAEGEGPCVQEGPDCELLASEAEVMAFDARGNPTVIHTTAFDVAGVRQVQVQYDSDGVFPAEIVDSLGFFTTTLTHPALGVPILHYDVNGVGTARVVDGFGREVSRVPTGGIPVTTTYAEIAIDDHVGLAINRLGDDGSVHRIETDELGRPIRSMVPGFAGAWVYSDREYDHFGNVARSAEPTQTPASADWTAREFDRLGRPTKVTQPDSAVTEHFYTLFGSNTIDPEGDESYTLRDVDQRVIESGHFQGSDPFGEMFFSYGPFGLPTSTTDAAGNVSTRAYDAFGRTKLISDPDAGITELSYDGFGQLIEELRPTGDLLLREYDELGRLLRTSGPDGDTVFTYDQGPGARHRLTSATSFDDIATQLFYDELGRPLELSQTVGGVTRSVEQRYDELGRLSHQFYPEVPGFFRFTAEYQYDGFGRVGSIHDASWCQVSPDPNVPVPACTPDDLWEVTGRDDRLSLTAALFANGQTETRSYDAATGRLVGLSYPGLSVGYDYFLDGNLRSRTESGREETFQYDELDRLILWSLRFPDNRRDDKLTQYFYTEVGDLETVTENGTQVFGATFGFDNKPRTLAESTVGGPYEYDKLGRQETGDGRIITWNQIDKPFMIDQEGKLQKLLYDAFEQRVSRETEAGTTTYLGKLHEHRDSVDDGLSDVFLVYGETGVVAQVEYSGTATTKRYVVNDLLGSPVIVANGTTTKREWFDPFGKRIGWNGNATSDPDPETTFGFTGHEEDDDKLVNMNGRLFDRAQYRFLSPDPIIALPLFGQSHHPYSYVLNNPLRYVDPSGYSATYAQKPPPPPGDPYADDPAPPTGSSGPGPSATPTPAPARAGSSVVSDGNGGRTEPASHKPEAAAEPTVRLEGLDYFPDEYDAWGLDHLDAHPGGPVFEQATEYERYLRDRMRPPTWLGPVLGIVADSLPVLGQFKNFYDGYNALLDGDGWGVGLAVLGVVAGPLKQLKHLKHLDEGADLVGTAAKRAPNPTTGRGYGVSDPPVRIDGEWSINDMKQALLGHPPRGLGSPDLHHAGQMPGSGIHEVLPDLHRGNKALHPNKFNQGVTPEMRAQNRQLHWWYRAREQGADDKLPNWIYDD